MTKRKSEGDTDTHASWGKVESGGEQGQFEQQKPADTLVQKAQDAIETGLQKVDPEVLEWGQALIASLGTLAAPVRKSFKSQPVLTGAGLGAMAIGGVLLAVAVTRDRGGHQSRRTVVRDN